jgi:hypothetical protein
MVNLVYILFLQELSKVSSETEKRIFLVPICHLDEKAFRVNPKIVLRIVLGKFE